MAFRGNYDHTLDAKNRLTIPAKFRAALDGDIVIAQALEPCAAIWTAAAFESFTASFLNDLNPLSQESRQLSRYFNAGSFDGELDSAGRVMLAAACSQLRRPLEGSHRDRQQRSPRTLGAEGLGAVRSRSNGKSFGHGGEHCRCCLK